MHMNKIIYQCCNKMSLKTIIMKVFVLIAYISLSNSKSNYMPNLPLGEYRIVFEKIYSCESTNSIQFNLYFNKKTLSITELKGNFTNMVPFGDTFTLDINAASWDSIGGWKPNSIVYITKNACSNWKKILGNVWYTLFKSFNVSNTSCPIPVGTYITTGVDLKKLEDLNVPKVYFYGKYKLTAKIKNVKNKVFGCVAIEHSLVRPWETSTD